jgi:hypothetical protein
LNHRLPFTIHHYKKNPVAIALGSDLLHPRRLVHLGLKPHNSPLTTLTDFFGHFDRFFTAQNKQYSTAFLYLQHLAYWHKGCK